MSKGSFLRGPAARTTKIAVGLVFCLTLSACASQPAPATDEQVAELAGRLDEILHRRDRGAVMFGARVIDLDTGRELYSSRADEPVMPASNMKLPVSAAFLDRFGPDATFKTYLALDGDDLWLIGTGDPATGDPAIAKKHGKTVTTMLEEWATKLSERGVKEVKGNLYYWDGAFESQTIHPAWSRGYLTDWYAAPVTGLNFNDNCVDITVYPTTPGKPTSFSVVPPVANIEVVNECVTAEASTGAGTTGPATQPTIEREKDANVFRLGGATTKPAELKSKPVTDPGAFFADALHTHLSARGIRVKGKVVRAGKPLGGSPVPPADKVVAMHESKMQDILDRINKNSQNMFAEAAAKLAGQAFEESQGNGWQPGSWASGERAVKAFLEANGINSAALRVADGSGLSRANRVTARVISDLLVTMHRHPHGEAFRRSLSVAGKDGTLAKRMGDVTGHVSAKTGYIGGVRACSGYVRTRDGRSLAFSVIYNGIDGSVAPYEALQDQAIRTLVAWPNLDAAPSTQPTTTTQSATARAAGR